MGWQPASQENAKSRDLTQGEGSTARFAASTGTGQGPLAWGCARWWSSWLKKKEQPEETVGFVGVVSVWDSLQAAGDAKCQEWPCTRRAFAGLLSRALWLPRCLRANWGPLEIRASLCERPNPRCAAGNARSKGKRGAAWGLCKLQQERGSCSGGSRREKWPWLPL